MGPPQIKRLPSNNELLWHLFPISSSRARWIRQWVSILHFSLLDFQDSNLVLLPSTWQLSPAVQLRFQHKITRVVRSINFSLILQRSPEVSETTEKPKGLHYWVRRWGINFISGHFFRRMNGSHKGFGSHLLWHDNFEWLSKNCFLLRTSEFCHMTLSFV